MLFLSSTDLSNDDKIVNDKDFSIVLNRRVQELLIMTLCK
jgi:hypothetical protein